MKPWIAVLLCALASACVQNNGDPATEYVDLGMCSPTVDLIRSLGETETLTRFGSAGEFFSVYRDAYGLITIIRSNKNGACIEQQGLERQYLPI